MQRVSGLKGVLPSIFGAMCLEMRYLDDLLAGSLLQQTCDA